MRYADVCRGPAAPDSHAGIAPGIAASSGWRHVNRLLVRGLLESAVEARGVPVRSDTIGELQEPTLRRAFPHVVELRKGFWLAEFPGS
jgi:hypothetical protein